MSMPDYQPEEDDTYFWDSDGQYEDFGEGSYGDEFEEDD
jgi:hypothetical protein